MTPEEAAEETAPFDEYADYALRDVGAEASDRLSLADLPENPCPNCGADWDSDPPAGGRCGQCSEETEDDDMALQRYENEQLRAGTKADPLEAEVLARAVYRATWAQARWGPHPNAEFSCCRIAEEAGELVQAATSRSRGRGEQRLPAIYAEAIDTIAMVLRLLREFPKGVPSVAAPDASDRLSLDSADSNLLLAVATELEDEAVTLPGHTHCAARREALTVRAKAVRALVLRLSGAE